MRKLYTILRGVGYVGGLVGLGCFLYGKNLETGGEVWTQVGGILLALMFFSMLCSYVLFAMMQMARKSR